MRKPRIAIPVMNQNVENYMNAVIGAGMDPVVVSVSGQSGPQEYLDYSEFREADFDGLLLPGGGDIDPARYGEENQGSLGILKELDDLQFELLDQFVKQQKPILGICRGHQVLNVYFGGSLIQHLPTSHRHSKAAGEDDKIHGCIAEKGSWLAEIYDEVFLHNSSHHQAVKALGEGLVIDSRCAEDSVVEGFHHRTLPIISVQWHPERTCLKWRREGVVNGLVLFLYFNRMCLENMLKSGQR